MVFVTYLASEAVAALRRQDRDDLEPLLQDGGDGAGDFWLQDDDDSDSSDDSDDDPRDPSYIPTENVGPQPRRTSPRKRAA